MGGYHSRNKEHSKESVFNLFFKNTLISVSRLVMDASREVAVVAV